MFVVSNIAVERGHAPNKKLSFDMQRHMSELYNQAAEHYIDVLHELKEEETMPKNKKQARRANIEDATKEKVSVKPGQKRKCEDTHLFHCPICNDVCVKEQQSHSEISIIGCDGCCGWFHLPSTHVSNPKRKQRNGFAMNVIDTLRPLS